MRTGEVRFQTAGDGYILRTTDGGTTWTTQSTDLRRGRVTAVSCAGSTCVALQGFGQSSATGKILWTTDGGNNWSVSGGFPPNSPGLFRVSCGDADACTAAGSGIIMRTADSGATWNEQFRGASSLLGVSFANANTGTVVGAAGFILRTDDGGITWVEQSRGTRTDLNAVSFTDASTGTAVGRNGTILRTTDGGATWVEQSSGTTQGLNAVSFIDADTGTAVGANGTILRTIDGGASWVPQSSGTTRSLSGVSCADAQTCTAVGYGPTDLPILRTNDGGITWMQQSGGAGSLLGISCTDVNTCTAVGLSNNHRILLMRTSTGGAIWNIRAYGVYGEDPPPLNAVSCTDFYICTAVGSDVLLRTTDGWETWTTTQFEGALGISCPDVDTCTTVSATIRQTRDGAATWTTQSSGSFRVLNGISCTDADTCTAVGTIGTIVRTETSQSASYDLTVVKDGNGDGAVTSSSSPAGAGEIDCGSTCTATYASGTVVTLAAQAAIGSTFASWNGCDAVSGATCTVTTSEEKWVGATFTGSHFPLTVWQDGSGSGRVTSSPAGIDCGLDCSQTYASGTVVTLVAAAAAGSTFAGWSGCDTVSDMTCTVTTSEEKWVGATFTGSQFPLTVWQDGTGSGRVTSNPAGIDCGFDCSQTYASGTVVTLVAAADAGSIFAGWSGCDTVSDMTCTVTTSEEKWVGATFTGSQFPLTVWQDGSGSGRVTSSPAGIDCGLDCSETYASGTVVTLVAAADAGSTFAGWSGCDTVSDMTCTVTTSEERWVGATFTGSHFPLTVWQDGSGSGRVTSSPAGIDCGLDCSETYASGTVVTLVAAADAGSTFAGWSGCDTVSDMTCTVTTSEERWVGATFTGSTVEP